MKQTSIQPKIAKLSGKPEEDGRMKKKKPEWIET